ncbi:hypothetical protein [Nocardia thailandica]|uniref:hypothetical protein n=1 Tax=Nocardia thailandica TaxID=257275 RepID=UPI0002E31431|nr:hypothetical protein [Nocardia thailandica]
MVGPSRRGSATADFRITAGYAGDKTIEAHHFEVVGSLIIFYSGAETRSADAMYAIPLDKVITVEKVSAEN